MINEINLNRINSWGMQNHSQNFAVQNNQSDSTMELSGYKAGQAILARSNISFRNLAKPVEVTDKYNKKVEGQDHLDLPNIHVYEYPDTNLKVFLNIDNNCDKPQLALFIDSSKDNYDIIKQALANKLIAQKFKSQKLDLYYDYDLVSPMQFIFAGNKNPLDIPDMKFFNKILTETHFDEESLNKAKKELVKYLSSEQYSEDNYLANVLYSGFIDTKDDTINRINSMRLNDLEKYQKEYLQNASIKMFLTINEQDLRKNDIFKELNQELKNKFKKVIKNSPDILNDELKIIHKQAPDTCIKFSYFVNNNNTKDSLIFELISREYPFLLTADEPINEPLTLKAQNKGYYGSRYSISQKIDENNVSSIIQMQKELNKKFIQLLNQDFSYALNSIKDEYKHNLVNDLKICKFSNLKNLKIAYHEENIFNVYEMIDSIQEQDIKQYIEKYFIKQPAVIEIECTTKTYQNIIKELNNEN